MLFPFLQTNCLSKYLNLQVFPEGTHFKIPWFERPIIYDVRAHPHLVESTSGSRDLQMVHFNSRLSLIFYLFLYKRRKIVVVHIHDCFQRFQFLYKANKFYLK